MIFFLHGETWEDHYFLSQTFKYLIEPSDLKFDVHLFLQVATVIGWNKSRDLFLVNHGCFLQKQMNIELQVERVYGVS